MERKKEGFVDGIVSLMFSQGVIKIFGLAYSMYLINKEGFGDSGNAIYIGAYQFFVLLLTITSMGIPNSISKLVSEKIGEEDYIGANRIFKVAFIFFGMIGILGSIVLFYSAKYISNKFLLIPECEYGLIILSPAIFFVTESAVIKGYFNGIQNISQTAKAQMIEQVFKSFFTILIIEVVSKRTNDTILFATIANSASTFAVIISFGYMFLNFIKLRFSQRIYEKRQKVKLKEKKGLILKRIFAVSIPLTVSAILGGIGKSIDSITVVRILTPILGETTAKLKYGILSSKIDILTAMPLAFNMAFSVALVPAISIARTKKDSKSINKKISFSLLLTMLIAFPSAIGMSLYSNQILGLLFPNASSGGELLKISAFCIIFIAMTQTIGGVLQGIGKVNICVNGLLIGMIVKFFCNLLLVRVDGVYEKGAVIGNLFSNIVNFFIVWNSLKRYITLNFSLLKLAIKPIIATVIMAISSYNLYLILIRFNFSSRISTIIGIILAVFIYIVSIILLKIFKKEEYILLPKGNNIIELLEKFKILT